MNPIFQVPSPRWFSVPAHRPFILDLAQGLYDALSPEGPQALSQALVLTPTRRGARALADAFVTVVKGHAVLPPQIRPLGDLDEGEAPFEPGDLALDLPAAITPLRRRFELVGLVKSHEKALGRDLDAPAALDLADALGGFLDSLQIEEVSAAKGLAELVDADMAQHWRVSREFLEMALEAWPRRLLALGLADVSARRVALLRALAEKWESEPPTGVLVAAGSTGTAKSTGDLLAVIARAPQGCVVLPGLDEGLADKAWGAVDEQHPQGAMKRLLDRIGLTRGDITHWPGSPKLGSEGRWRRRVINEALRPASETADWLKSIRALRVEGKAEKVDPIIEGLKGLSLVTARTEDEAAMVAALLMREVLETPDKTVALVCPDQTLARRVSAKLARWGISADSSAGVTLSGCPCGVLTGLVAGAAVDPLDPVRMLAVLKHPLVKLGMGAEEKAADLEVLERYGLRGARPASWERLEAKLKDHPGAVRLIQLYRQALPVVPDEAEAASTLAHGLTQSLEAFAGDVGGSVDPLWSGLGGEGLARLLGGLIAESDCLPLTSGRAFCELLTQLMSGETVRDGGASHPRLRILGAIEARLTRADRLILAGLEEGTWPQAAPVDPFLSRPMRKALDLPSPERRVGLAAHDFAQAACAPEVILLHSERRDGAPAVKSRWLWRLETLAKGANTKERPVEIASRTDILDWARRLDAPGAYDPAPRPAPRPPVADRPRELAVTRVEALTRDPYSVWARDILKFFILDRPDQPIDSRARGSAIHEAFDQFAKQNPGALPDDAAARFEHLYLQALEDQGMPHEAMARERALAREAAEWVKDQELERRADGRQVHSEVKGKLSLGLAGGDFLVTAKADRVEIDPHGFGHVLDYKTGSPPSDRQVKAGFSPQLTLTAAILAGGGFPDLGRPKIGELVYLQVTGRRPAGKVTMPIATAETAEAAEKALKGLGELIDRFDQPEQPYLSRIAPTFVHMYQSDYDHLARVFEWSTSGEGEEE